MDHSYEEIRNVVLDLLAGREKAYYDLTQYEHLLLGVASVFMQRELPNIHGPVGGSPPLPRADKEKFFRNILGAFP